MTLPDGSSFDPTTADFDEISDIVLDYLEEKNPRPDDITPEHLEVRKKEADSLLSITCDKCGMPHNFEHDIPHTRFNCTLCGNTLLVYLDQELEGIYEDEREFIK